MKAMTRILLVLAVTGLMLGCSKVTRENYDKLKVGMTMDEVVAVIGEPDTCSGAMGAKKCTWGNEAKNIRIAFVGNHVTLSSMTGL